MNFHVRIRDQYHFTFFRTLRPFSGGSEERQPEWSQKIVSVNNGYRLSASSHAGIRVLSPGADQVTVQRSRSRVAE
eukprot:3076074-Rhodomonas_salina.2